MNIRHGDSGSPLYRLYYSIRSRCKDSKNIGWPDYGGRGIKCEFLSYLDFKNYIKENLGDRPPGKTLDRFPDNNGNYSPGNLRWATPKQQNENQRRRRGLSVFKRESGSYKAELEFKKKRYYLGNFKTKELAILAAETFKDVLYTSKEQ